MSDRDDDKICDIGQGNPGENIAEFTVGSQYDDSYDEHRRDNDLIFYEPNDDYHHRLGDPFDASSRPRFEKGIFDDEDDDDLDYDPNKRVIVGICAMEKKAQSKPMKEILRRLEDYFEYIETLVFDEAVILNKPIEEWPLCDCLISFHSKGFPLSKAIEYARLRKPYVVNDLDIQYDIQDRRKVYKMLEEADIELPRYVVLDRDSANPEERELIEGDDHIEIGNFVFNKPFVEKPISAEDHNICIYYPAHAGGGSQRLFRKIGCRSSVYSNESHVRKTGSYIYEEFMPTDGTDVKVYTAGPDYAHAEARKSPALDGKVERDKDGKEIRYPVILTNKEKLISRKVCLAFKQTVCGFDLLRANGKSYVCDVNGFSFVKSSMKYYEDCSKILGNMMLRALAPRLHIPWSIPFQLDDPPIVPTTFGRMMELRCVIAVIRHGDRTPKQKMKLEVKHAKFFELYHKYGNTKSGQAKLKKPKQLQEVLDIARYLLGELPDQPLVGEVVEPRVKLRQLKSVLEMYGHFSGINRKVQLKYQPHGRPRRSSSEEDVSASGATSQSESTSTNIKEPSLVLILKWGGELTPAGRVQAEELGRCFRRLYPASGDYSGPQGLGLLRLHSTFRHDLKIYASDEGRVQMTAAAFAKGFLALEGELTPILFQMVKSANTNGLLDDDFESSKCQKIVKERLHEIMHRDHELIADDLESLNPTHAPSIEAACKFIGNPYQACEKVHKLIKELNALIKAKRQDHKISHGCNLYHGETWDLLQRRWAKLEKDFKFPRTKRFDISKIPDIYDCIKYDLQHNQHTLQFMFAHELYTYAKALADIVVPQEYGLNEQEKLMISLGTCSPLLRKIQADLLHNADSANDDESESVNRLDPKCSYGVSSPDRHVRTRLYFTSESHIQSLATALQFGGLVDVKDDEQWQRSMEFLGAISELNYLSQIVVMLYEDPSKPPSSDDRFHVEIHFSSGVMNRISQNQNLPNEPQGPGFRPHVNTGKSFNSETENTAEPKTTTRASSSEPEVAAMTAINDSGEQQSHANISSPASIRAKMIASGKQINEHMIREEPIDECDDLGLDTTSASSPIGQFGRSSTTKILENSPNVTKSLEESPIISDQQLASTDDELIINDKDISGTPPAVTSSATGIGGGQSRQRIASQTQLVPKRRLFTGSQTNTSGAATATALDGFYSSLYHCSFSPTALRSKIGTSLSTSPQATGSAMSMMQRHHQQQQQQQQQQPHPTSKQFQLGNKQFFTMSASIPAHYRSQQSARACSVADVSQYCLGPSSLISTAVISGSSPDLVAMCPYSPNIRPLETLHNELSLKQFIDFIVRLTRSHRSSTAFGDNPRNRLTEATSFSSSINDKSICCDDLLRRGNSVGGQLLAMGGGGGSNCGGDQSFANLTQSTTSLASANSGNNGNNNNNNNNNLQSGTSNQSCNMQPVTTMATLSLSGPTKKNLSGSNGSSCQEVGQDVGGCSQTGSGIFTPAAAGTLAAPPGNSRSPGLTPGNSLSNSLVWSGPSSSFASSPGPSSPSAVLDMWSKLELDDSTTSGGGGGQQNQAPANSSNLGSPNLTATSATPIQPQDQQQEQQQQSHDASQ